MDRNLFFFSQKKQFFCTETGSVFQFGRFWPRHLGQVAVYCAGLRGNCRNCTRLLRRNKAFFSNSRQHSILLSLGQNLHCKYESPNGWKKRLHQNCAKTAFKWNLVEFTWWLPALSRRSTLHSWYQVRTCQVPPLLPLFPLPSPARHLVLHLPSLAHHPPLLLHRLHLLLVADQAGGRWTTDQAIWPWKGLQCNHWIVRNFRRAKSMWEKNQSLCLKTCDVRKPRNRYW